MVRYDLEDFWSNGDWIKALDQQEIKVRSFGVDQELADYSTFDMRCSQGMMSFKWSSDSSSSGVLRMPGLHNLYNATAALAVSELLQVDRDQLINSLSTFEGIERRYDIVHRSDGLVVIDDYAHHPVEITAAIAATRANFSNRKLTVLFQPHLFSRTADFSIEFANALDLADEVVLFPIYPARELPMPGVTSEIIYEHMMSQSKELLTMSQWIENVDFSDYELLLVLGAGDISKLIHKILIKLK